MVGKGIDFTYYLCLNRYVTYSKQKYVYTPISPAPNR